MKQTIKLLTIIITFCIPLATIAQDNTFNGTTDSSWDDASNWSTGHVPSTSIVQKIIIAVDCDVTASNSDDYTFYQGSTLIINSGISFTNSGTGSWTMQGTIINDGTYTQATLNNEGTYYGSGTFIGNLTNDGLMEPGDAPSSTWSCGDVLSYGGQDYATIKIGGQCWMAENLNVGVENGGYGDEGIIGKYCWGNNSNNCNTYGGLYRWNEVMQYVTTEGAQGICPTGWHIPSDDEFKILEMELGLTQAEADATGIRGTNQGSQLAGNANLWNDGALENDPDFGSSGFDGLPAGYKWTTSWGFSGIHTRTNIWSSSEDGTAAWNRGVYNTETGVDRSSNGKIVGFSARCVKD